MDRFACDWHRLATTDPLPATEFYYTASPRKLQEKFYRWFTFFAGKRRIARAGAKGGKARKKPAEKVGNLSAVHGKPLVCYRNPLYFALKNARS
ncbi:MAG: hypothetical protein PUK86_04705 [bacterium]|nr:hypothetical protein [bacterium]